MSTEKRMSAIPSVAISFWLVFIVVLPGCRRDDPQAESVPVSGTITLDGEPLEGAEVNFYSARFRFLGSGLTDANGQYEIFPGAMPGKNKVWITKNPNVSAVNPVPLEPVPRNPNPKDDAAGAQNDKTAKEQSATETETTAPDNANADSRDTGSAPQPSPTDDQRGDLFTRPPGELVPAKYSDPNQTVLEHEVPEDGSDRVDFELKSE